MKVIQVRMLQLVAAMGWLLAAIFGLGLFLGGVLEPINSYLEEHDSLFLSIGVLVFVSFLALFTGHLTNQSAERRELFSQKMQALIKISEFRQAWIDRVREDFARLQVCLVSDNGEITPEAVELIQRLRLSLNKDDKNTLRIEKALGDVLECLEGKKSEELGKSIGKMNREARVLLKWEWERLKKDLEEAQSIQEALK